MKRFNYFLILLGLTMIGFTSCSESESEELIVDVNERIVGKWMVDSQTLFEVNVPGDGSWITFDGCATGDCTGTDYMASDESTGTFSYIFGTNNSTLIIEDNDAQQGGSYSGEWTIEQFTNNKLVISIDTGLFGVTTITLKK